MGCDTQFDVDKSWYKEENKSKVTAKKTKQTKETLPVISEVEANRFDGLVEHIRQSAVNHPSHYTNHPSGIECIQITEHMNFCLGNAIKYIWRAGLKDNTAAVEDLMKASWYIDREIMRLGDRIKVE